MVVPDETGWRENGQSCWQWVFATPTTTVYLITKGRGFAEASLVLPADYAGTLVRDGWVAYREYAHAQHQSCLGHLLHRCETLTTDHPYSTFAPAVHAILQAGLAARDRWREGRISDHGAAVIRGQLVHQLDLVLDAPGPLPAMRRFARHLDREFPHLFTFLTDLEIDATNYRAEQAIRPSVGGHSISVHAARGRAAQNRSQASRLRYTDRRASIASAPGPRQRIPGRFMRCWTTWWTALSTAPLPM
jgi:transposase